MRDLILFILVSLVFWFIIFHVAMPAWDREHAGRMERLEQMQRDYEKGGK